MRTNDMLCTVVYYFSKNVWLLNLESKSELHHDRTAERNIQTFVKIKRKRIFLLSLSQYKIYK